MTETEPLASVDLTKVLIGADSAPFNMKAIDEAEGARLVAALPADKQKDVARLAAVIMNFRTPLASDLPENLKDPSVFQKALAKLEGNPNIKTFGDALRAMKDDAFAQTVGLDSNDTMLLRAVFVGAPSQYGSMLAYPFRKGFQQIVSMRESANALPQPPSEKQAVAIAAVYIATTEHLMTAPDAPEDMKHHAAGALDTAQASGESFFDMLKDNTVGRFIAAVWKMAEGWWNDAPIAFDVAMEQVKAEIKQAGENRKTVAERAQEIADNGATEKAQQAALDKIEATDIDTVAGLSITPFLDTLKNGGLYAGFDNKLYGLDKQTGRSVEINLNGQPLDTKDLEVARENAAVGSISTATTEDKIAFGIAGVAASRTAIGVGAGMAKRLAVTPVVQAVDDFSKASGKIQALDARMAKAEAGKADLWMPWPQKIK